MRSFQAPGGNEVFTKRIYIITDAAGFLGNNRVRQLQDKPEAAIRCLLLPGTSLQALRCQLYYSSITEPESLKEIFTVPAGIPVCVIHCAGPTISMMTLARMAARFNHTRPVRLEVPLDLVEAAAPRCGDLKKPLFTAFAASTLKSDSNFDVSRSVADLGFTTRPVEQTVQDIIAFQQRIFRLDADAVLGLEGLIRPRKNPAWQIAGLAAARLGTAWLARKAAGKSRW